MSTVELERSSPSSLPSVYSDWSQEQFIEERDRVHAATAIERSWIGQAGLKPYETDDDMIRDAQIGKTIRVGRGAGYLVTDKLLLWDPTHTDPKHEHYYSAPYLHTEAADYLTGVANEWQSEMGLSRSLSVTSLGRSMAYQAELKTRRRKVTVVGEDTLSYHQTLRAFDLDGCGLVETDDDGNVHKINPRYPNFKPGLVLESQLILRDILHRDQRQGRINFVEELKGTQEQCFHVAVKPSELL